MKKIILILLSLCLLLCLLSCEGKDKNDDDDEKFAKSPEEVAELYIEAVNTVNLKQATKYNVISSDYAEVREMFIEMLEYGCEESSYFLEEIERRFGTDDCSQAADGIWEIYREQRSGIGKPKATVVNYFDSDDSDDLVSEFNDEIEEMMEDDDLDIGSSRSVMSSFLVDPSSVQSACKVKVEFAQSNADFECILVKIEDNWKVMEHNEYTSIIDPDDWA